MIDPEEGQRLEAEGWVWKQITANVDTNLRATFLAIIGEGNYRIHTSETVRDLQRGDFTRDVALVSPAGCIALDAWAAQQGKPN